MFREIALFILLFVILFWALRVIFNLLVFLFKKHPYTMYVSSFDRHIRLMKNGLHLVRWKRLVDLGCGDGKAMRFFAREFGLQWDGYEIQRFPYLYGKLLNRLWGYRYLTMHRKDFSHADIKAYDYIYLYLLPQQMAAIEDRVFSHMSHDAIIISNSFQFASHKTYETIKDRKGKQSIFLYRK